MKSKVSFEIEGQIRVIKINKRSQRVTLELPKGDHITLRVGDILNLRLGKTINAD